MRVLRRVCKILLGVMVFFVALCMSLLLSVQTENKASIYKSVAMVPAAQVAIVLGASIRSNGDLSPVLKERADAAYTLYTAKKVSKILVSGDNRTPQYNEVSPVGKYLLAKGVPKEDIFLDYAGFDTYSSMYRAEHVFLVSSAIVVSQHFHLPRALFLAHGLGISAVGFDAGAPGEEYLLNTFREMPASLKAIFDVLVGRIPQYLGPPLPISSSGTETWIGPKVEMIYSKNGK